MIILDAYAVLALLKGEAAAPDVRDILKGSEPARLTGVGVAEVIDHLIRQCRVDEEEATLDLAQLGLLDAVSEDNATAIRAGLLRARHYQRRHRPVSLADCFVAATAQVHSSRVASSDAPLLTLCHQEGIGIVALPDSGGRVWSPDAGSAPG
ncbi:MAG: PIN domain-containing protein [Actinobacteria bacterium]|nr:PIN domain-containing protein [Actinomycetota bacterium]MCB8998056.1 PIN domain-containing protein [Actinomycetota bacterium]MCB9413708.1 PIN domain-containing protein [Actinomycetota bacterium]MCB9424686.1 PIN domain-containing protein [Actinomycetota bacterium]